MAEDHSRLQLLEKRMTVRMFVGTYFRKLDRHNRISLPKEFSPDGSNYYVVRIIMQNTVLEFSNDNDRIFTANEPLPSTSWPNLLYKIIYKYPRIVIPIQILKHLEIPRQSLLAIVGIGRSFYICHEDNYRKHYGDFNEYHNTTQDGITDDGSVLPPHGSVVVGADDGRSRGTVTPSGLHYQEKRQIFDNHCWLGKFSSSEIDALMIYSRLERYPAGAEIFSKGSPGHSMMVVVSGTVKLSAVSLSGKEIVLSIINPGEIVGEIALLGGGDRRSDAIAMTDCELLVLNRRDFMPFLETHADICLMLIRILCQRLEQTAELVEDLLFRHLEARIAKALLHFAKRSSGPDTQGVTLELHLSQNELSSIVGSSRESVSKQLQVWQKAGFIELAKGSIVIRDRSAIEQLVWPEVTEHPDFTHKPTS